MSDIVAALRSEVVRLFDEGSIDLFVAYADSRLPLRSAATVIRDGSEVESLVWNRTCTSNLAALVPKLLEAPPGAAEDAPRIGVLAKGCVSRSLITLIKANQVARDSLVVVGIDCPGMIDPHKIGKRIPVADVRAAEFDAEGLVVRATNGTEHRFDPDEIALDDCRACRYRSAVFSDVFVGKPSPPRPEDVQSDPIDEHASMSPEERWARFSEEMSRCIRCYACREACPNCFCTECFADESDPRWIGVTAEQADVAFFHLGRAFHQAGRCVSCGACVAACPQGIDLGALYGKVNRDVARLFGVEVGVSLDEPEPLCRFSLDDEQTFLTEP